MKMMLRPIAATLAFCAIVLAANAFVPNDQPFGYVAPVALSSASLASGTETVYAPWFENGTYQGDLIAYPISSGGDVDMLSPAWHANARLDSLNWDTGRYIVTTDGAGSAIPLRFASLTPAQQSLVTSADVVDYVRGRRDLESQNGGNFRDRGTVLGDIIHSPPVYVAAPKAGYPFDGYPAFAVANAARAPRVYVGANDGMLHAFDAATGDEVFSFVPSAVLGNLSKLTQTPYQHQYFVDGGLNAADVCFNCPSATPDWHTILVGGLGAGGQGFFALDLTSTTALTSETNTALTGAGSKVLWEFTASDDADLGYAYSRPSIVRLNDGSWAVAVGNGYRNTGTGKAALYLLDVETGTVLKKLSVSVTGDGIADPNGLSSPTVVDEDGDFRADAIFAGDIKGNIWKFDIQDPDPANWLVAYGGKPLYTAVSSSGARQSITAAPDVARHPDGGLMVYVGTGALFAASDAVDLSTQTIYGIRDNNWSAATLPKVNELVEQTLTQLDHPDISETVRVATDKSVDYTVKKGWFVELPGGERMLQDPIIRDKRLQFVTVNPTVKGTENWLLQLDYLTGGAPDTVILDIDGDGDLDLDDNVDGDGDGNRSQPEERVVGQYQDIGLASRPNIASLSNYTDVVLINHLHVVESAVLPFDPNDPGLAGGHFDLDTSSDIYPFDGGSTDGHVHQWDDKTGRVTVDFLSIYDSCSDPSDVSTCTPSNKLFDLDEIVSNADQRFIITVSNALLSSGGMLEINGASMSVVDYQLHVVDHQEGEAALPVYKLGALTQTDIDDGVQQLTSFKITFDPLALAKGGLIGTNTGCVRSNKPGAHDEYRNGALIVQALDPQTATLDAVHSYATSGLLWEASLFWHWKGECYGEDQWQETWDDCFINANYDGCGLETLDEQAKKKPKKDKKKKDKKKKDGSDDGGAGSSGSPGTVDPLQDLSSTVTSGEKRTGRLLWRELLL